jgi:hypothetical protein
MNAVVYAVRSEEKLGNQISSVRESVKRGIERMKLKNFHC